jgi:hypothetical protein
MPPAQRILAGLAPGLRCSGPNRGDCGAFTRVLGRLRERLREAMGDQASAEGRGRLLSKVKPGLAVHRSSLRESPPHDPVDPSGGGE